MGSHGVKAVAAAAMGASVTCVDISPANTQYGQQLAAAAGVDVRFVVSDVLQLAESEHAGELLTVRWAVQLHLGTGSRSGCVPAHGAAHVLCSASEHAGDQHEPGPTSS
jgi:D-arabinose 1-dehydrogenase-like Zn-dependent alcohol dehydrogenase